MVLKLTLTKPINGYWDGGPKQVFNYSIDGDVQRDSKGQYVRVGSWEANSWFHVSVGKTVKQTLANARRHLLAGLNKMAKSQLIGYKFEYVE